MVDDATFFFAEEEPLAVEVLEEGKATVLAEEREEARFGATVAVGGERVSSLQRRGRLTNLLVVD